MRQLILLLLAVFCWLGLTSVAYAEPVTIALFGSAFASTLLGTVVTQLITAAAFWALSWGLGLLDQGQEKREPGVKGSLRAGGDLPRAFVMGTYATAGSRVYVGTWGEVNDTPNAYLSDCIAISDIPVGGLVSLRVNGELVTVDTGTTTDKGWPVTTFRRDGTDYMWLQFFDGTQVTANTLLTSKFGTDPDRPFDATMIGIGVSYAVVTTRVNRELFNGFPRYLFETSGINLYDIRKDDTAGGSGTHRWNDPSTWEPSDNTAVQMYNIRRGISYNGSWLFGGQDLPAYRLPASNWMAAMNACDTPIPLAGGGSEAQFRSGCEIELTQKPLDVLEELAKSSSARQVEAGGIYKIQIGVAAAAVFSITDGDILISKSQSFEPFPGLESVYNGVNGSYPEPAEAYNSKDAPPIYRSDLEAADDGNRFMADVSFGYVPYSNQVQRLMTAMIEESRRFRKHEFTLPPIAWLLEPGDTISWTSEINGYSDKKFIVEAIVGSQNLLQQVVLREVDPADYDGTAVTIQPITVVPIKINYPTAQPMVGWAVSGTTLQDKNGTDRRAAIALTWSPILNDVRAVQYEVRRTGETDLETNGTSEVVIAGGLLVTEGIAPDTDYQARGKYIPYSGRETSWSAWIDVTTPNITISSGEIPNNIIDIPKLAQDVRDLQYWLGFNSRELIQELENLLAGVADQDIGNYLAVHQIERTLRAELGNNAAYFQEQIIAAVGPDSAIVAQITTLEAEVTSLDGTVTGNSSAISALTTRVDTNEGDIIANANLLTQLDVSVDEISAESTFRMNAYASPGGGWSRIGFESRVTTGDVWSSASLFLESKTDGSSRIVMEADETVILDSFGNILAMFSTDELNYALIPTLSADKINVTELSAITVDAGDITAGLLRSSDNKMRIELDNSRILIAD